jgi:hypothetical protein
MRRAQCKRLAIERPPSYAPFRREHRMTKKACGTHVELTSNDAVRVTRCTCGTVHVTLNSSGVTVRMSAEALRNVAQGLRTAADRVDETTPHLGSSTIN